MLSVVLLIWAVTVTASSVDGNHSCIDWVHKQMNSWNDTFYRESRCQTNVYELIMRLFNTRSCDDRYLAQRNFCASQAWIAFIYPTDPKGMYFGRKKFFFHAVALIKDSPNSDKQQIIDFDHYRIFETNGSAWMDKQKWIRQVMLEPYLRRFNTSKRNVPENYAKVWLLNGKNLQTFSDDLSTTYHRSDQFAKGTNKCAIDECANVLRNTARLMTIHERLFEDIDYIEALLNATKREKAVLRFIKKVGALVFNDPLTINQFLRF